MKNKVVLCHEDFLELINHNSLRECESCTCCKGIKEGMVLCNNAALSGFPASGRRTSWSGGCPSFKMHRDTELILELLEHMSYDPR